jgi:signal transduction histidine kinase
MEDAFGKGEQEVHEFRVIAKDGGEIWVSGIGTRIEYGGKLAVLSSIRDITERKRAEEQRKRMEEQLRLASRLAAVGELAAGVGHELNNPIAAIQGFAQFLAARKDLDETTRKDLDTIYRESQRAAKITRNLLSFARRHEPEKHLISINEAIEKTLELQAHPMKVNNIELVVELAPDLPKTLADFHQMQQVFINIINNAEQAMVEAHGKGRLVVKTQMVGSMIRISFADNGPGVSEENIKRIFDPFFTTKEVGKGTGLGLSICYGLVEAHGGRIYARSKLGQGATFVVEIPIVFEDRLVAEAALVNSGSRGAKWKKPKGQY